MQLMADGEIEYLLHRIDVLAHQCFDARALAAIECIDDVVVLPVRVH
jgi:hypothetical protein